MSLTARIRFYPRPFDPDRTADALAKLPDPGEARNLLAGVAGCSSYLAGLMAKEAAWLETALTAEPEEMLQAELDQLMPGPLKETSKALRRAKRRIALLAGLADCGGVWELHDVTGALTRLADRSVDVAIKSALAPVLAAGKLPGQSQDDLETAAGLTVLAMGKTGAYELNYSSDIDLIILFDDLRYPGAAMAEARQHLVKVVRKAMALLSELTDEGYVFRTDLRLRPDPSVTPVAIAISGAERYYESLGRTWERAAYIKARPAAGDIAAGKRFLHDIRPFVWRRHLDFATVEETQEMQARIRAEKNTWDDAHLDGRNLKLGPGGIREIEFFTQTRQMIAGGRDRNLRVRGTCEGLGRLAVGGWITPSEASDLQDCYTRLRTWEHRVQMVQDAQTHDLPKDVEGWERLAAFLGLPDAAALQAELHETFQHVQSLTAPSLPLTADSKAKTGHPAVAEVAERWRGFPALRSERAQSIMARLLPDLLTRFERAARPEEALTQFERFLSRLPAGVQLFSLFAANPQLIDLMVDIASTSPALAEYLSRRAQVLDAVIGGSFFSGWPGREVLAVDLAGHLTHDLDDYEQRLDAARRWHKEWRFRIGVHHLRGLITSEEAAGEYSDLADAVLMGLLPVVVEQLAERHGPPPGQGFFVLGMGSLGGRALTATSDLDLIVIYDAAGDSISEGRRPLPARTYYAKLTKALVTALSAQMSEGQLYEVDMRLRPSGKQGPVATSWAAFQTYQREDAWVWEHMALTRARPVAGDKTLCDAFDAFRETFLSEPSDAAGVRKELMDMRARLAAAKPRKGLWDMENGPGGRQDIELLAQSVALVAGSAEATAERQLASGPLQTLEAERLAAHLRLFAALKQTGRLLTGGLPNPDALGEGGRAMLLRETGAEDISGLEHQIETARTEAAALVDCFIDAVNLC